MRGPLAFAATGTGVVGSVVAVVGEVVLATIVAWQGIGADTPIEGVTLGILAAALVALAALSARAALRGGRALFMYGERWASLRVSLEAAADLAPLVRDIQADQRSISEQVALNTEQISALQRWRDAVDPIVEEWRRRSRWPGDRTG